VTLWQNPRNGAQAGIFRTSAGRTKWARWAKMHDFSSGATESTPYKRIEKP